MVILGLTGSIGMGKTVATNDFRRLGIPVHDADGVVHELLAPGGKGAEAVRTAFSGIVSDGCIDRRRVADLVFDDDDALTCLEAILHPMVRFQERRFLATMARRRESLVVLDIPLLFETGGERRCDVVVTVSAPSFVQAARVLKRPDMTKERLVSILARQLPDAEKRWRADFVVRTGLGRSESLREIRKIVTCVRSWRGRNWPVCSNYPRISL